MQTLLAHPAYEQHTHEPTHFEFPLELVLLLAALAFVGVLKKFVKKS